MLIGDVVRYNPKKISRESWDKDHFLIADNCSRYFHSVYTENHAYEFDMYDLMADDWFVLEE